jgi:hypothetical protein
MEKFQLDAYVLHSVNSDVTYNLTSISAFFLMFFISYIAYHWSSGQQSGKFLLHFRIFYTSHVLPVNLGLKYAHTILLLPLDCETWLNTLIKED